MKNLLDPWFKVNLGEGAFKAVLGLVFVFAGILVLVGIFTLLGFIMKKINGRTKKTEEKPAAPVPERKAEKEDEISPEVVAAITAALMSYYQKENIKCDFVVRRIKRV